ncbi:MAG: VOC family protein [Nocardioidaceae bacterium]|nr:VOC family protein [Nocardioidaceae bacterium]NUS51017.1 VOC family protein [Nocardioidaceae bacterium]
MSGRVVHFEVPFEDQERAIGFYSEVFGWQIQPLPEMSYVMVTTGPSAPQGGGPEEPGFVNGGMLARNAPIGGPVLVLEVEDIDKSLEQIGERGGTTVEAKVAVGDMGFSAYFRDPEGNLMGLWQSAPH